MIGVLYTTSEEYAAFEIWGLADKLSPIVTLATAFHRQALNQSEVGAAVSAPALVKVISVHLCDWLSKTTFSLPPPPPPTSPILFTPYIPPGDKANVRLYTIFKSVQVVYVFFSVKVSVYLPIWKKTRKNDVF